jgi:hypothetical protein
VSSFFNKFFGKKDIVDPIIQFGRYTDHYKPRTKNAHWDQSMQLKDKKDYLGSLKEFLIYLNDDQLNNVTYIEEPQKIRFRIYQGSKCVEGFANQDSFFAEVKLAKFTKQDLGAFRQLLEENYMLQYCSFAMDSDNNLTLTMHSEYEDASPYKLYYGLKEMATRADKKDDVLIEKFDSLEAINDGLIIDLPPIEKKIKYEFMISSATQTINQVDADYDMLKNHSALITYRLLNMAYTFDYLLKPEGMSMELIEKINDVSLNQKFLIPDQKNRELIKLSRKFLERTPAEFGKEIYETKATFGTKSSANHTRLKEMVDTDMQHYTWYLQNGFEEQAKYIPQYIASFLLYSYAMPLPDKKYLHLIMRLGNDQFFTSLGFASLLKDRGVNKTKVSEILERIREEESEVYSGLEMIGNKLDYQTPFLFIEGLLRQLAQTDIKKKSYAKS